MVQAGTDKNHPPRGGAQHLCSAVEPVADPSVLAMAADGRRYLGCAKRCWPHRSARDVCVRMVDRTDIDFFDQSFRSVRITSGVSLSSRQGVPADYVPDAGSI